MIDSTSAVPLPLALCLMGPTASGKTGLAIKLRQQLPVELISVDASQVYRELNIGTAKPSLEEQKLAPHRLIDIREPAETYSAAEFCRDALEEMRQITAAGRIPLLVGGTMFYFRALEFGLSELPEADANIRAELETEARSLGWPAMHERLATIDPAIAQRIDRHDAQRIQRALEIYRLTGMAPSEAQAQTRQAPPPYRFIKAALMPGNRERLRQDIARRFVMMLEQGLVEEVDVLLKRGDINPSLASMRMVGYRQVVDYLHGKVDKNTMIDQAVTATRRLAKRQFTWLRSYPDVVRFDPQKPGFEQSVGEHFADKLGMICP
ncbi:MAG: tRNA (adenosine(37)-N6)-dimethylallyltransferase MiaA [Gammaproteobacteria bacterium]|nr:tRNA (adenosine(37)-N6)-dimethylallyltransferase MiaA [Gammaproteobacteria bacterium]